MNRDATGEAKRQVTLAETLYRRLLEKNRRAEEAYVSKIETLKSTHAALQEADAA
jgi:hypothetical protein